MAIIINEFEIVAPPDGATTDGERSAPRPAAAETTAAAPTPPADLAETLRHALQRRLRVWAD